MATPLGARRGFVVFVTFLFAVLAVGEAGATALGVALDHPAGRGLTVLAGLGALAFAVLTVIYARQWRRMRRRAGQAPGEPAGEPEPVS